MKFSDASVVEQVVKDLQQSDLDRSSNRAAIDRLANGWPPYTDDEVSSQNIKTNVNFLDTVVKLHDARLHLVNAFLKPSAFFNVRLDRGPKHKRLGWSTIITNRLKTVMKGSLQFQEVLRSEFAGMVLHGVGPSYWNDREKWIPVPLGIEDLLIPSGTLLTLENIQHFAVYRQYSAAELWKLTHGPNIDPGWNLPMVERCLKWADDEFRGGNNNVSNMEVWSPEKIQERFKENPGLYASDEVPTIDCFEFWFWNDEQKQAGWNKRIILDPDNEAYGKLGDKAEKQRFLYDQGSKRSPCKLSEILHLQFADLSAVPPFRYHSVRSLGFLLYAIGQLQNRLRCKFNDAVFESLLQFYRVSNPEEHDRVQKIDLVNYGIVPEGVNFVPPSERWGINERLVETAMEANQQMMGQSSSSYMQDFDPSVRDSRETATKTMQKANSSSQMVSSMLTLAYNYQEFMYQEISRRFCIKNSKDQDVKKFRLHCLKDGVPEEMLDVSCWEISAERVLGGGNKMIEQSQAQWLMQNRPAFDPDAQRIILQRSTLAFTDDAGLTDALVPDQPNKVSDSVHDAQLMTAALMMGFPVDIKSGENHQEICEVLLKNLGLKIFEINKQRGGMADPKELQGLQNVAAHIGQEIQALSVDPQQKPLVKQFSDALGKLENFLKAFQQRLQQAQKAQQSQNGNGAHKVSESMKYDSVPEDIKRQMEVQAGFTPSRMPQTDPKTAKTIQQLQHKDLAFKQKMSQAEQSHALDTKRKMVDTKVNIASTDLKTAADIKNSRLKSVQE